MRKETLNIAIGIFLSALISFGSAEACGGKVVMDTKTYVDPFADDADEKILTQQLVNRYMTQYENETSLTVEIAPGIEIIDDNAFRACTKLENLILPDSIKEIRCAAFEYCVFLKKVVFGKNITLIRGYAFHGCDNLQKVILPDSVQKIEDEAFSNCSNLEEIIFGKNITTIEERAFQGCKILQITLPDSVVRLGKDAFSFCYHLQTFKNSKNVTEICDGTFSYCKNLGDVDLGEKVTAIGEGAFKCCENLKKLFIPGGIQKLEKQSFKNAGLEEVTIGGLLNEGNVEVKSGVFDGCKNLSSIHFNKNFLIKKCGLGWGLQKLEKITWQEDCTAQFEADAIIFENGYRLNQSSRKSIKDINSKAIKVIRRRFL